MLSDLPGQIEEGDLQALPHTFIVVLSSGVQTFPLYAPNRVDILLDASQQLGTFAIPTCRP